MGTMEEEVAERHRRIQEARKLGIDPMLDSQAQYFDPKAEKIFMECRASGEPMIIFRARDILSLMVIAHYQGLVETYLPEATEFQERVSEKGREVREWQRKNPSRIHLPD
jgi:hypothetical protein